MLKFALVILFLNPVFAVLGGLNEKIFPAASGGFLSSAEKIIAAAAPRRQSNQTPAKTPGAGRQNYLSLLNVADISSLPANGTSAVPESETNAPAVQTEKASEPEPSAPSRSELSAAEAGRLIYPARNFNVLDIEINADSYLLYDAERDIILYSKNIEKKMFIASLTKLITAMVVLDFGKADDVTTVSKAAVETEEDFGNLVVNEKISVENLLYALLVESSNDAATALAEYVAALKPENSAPAQNGKTASEYFVGLMNEKAAALGLKNTHFTTPSGLDGNYSTALDLVRLTKASFDYPLLWKIMKLPSADVFSADKKIKHHLVNSNKLLSESNVLGGKTGYTEEAGECMILVHEIKQGQRNIFVILKSTDRMAEMKKFIRWSTEAFLW